MSGRSRLRAFVPGAAREVLREGGRSRRLGPRRPPARDWRVSEGGRAPRLGTREFIGHDVRGVGAFEEKDPLKVPRFWRRAEWGGLLGWAVALTGSGWIAWRRHGGKDAFRD